MNIQELKTEREAFENRLRKMLQQEVDYFQEITGVSVKSIDVDMLSIQITSKPNLDYFVEKVKVNLDLQNFVEISDFLQKLLALCQLLSFVL